MIPWLLGDYGLFSSITVRAAAGTVTAFVLSLLLGRLFIRLFRERRIWEPVEKVDAECLIDLRRQKRQVPTMGGIFILLAVLLASGLWTRLFDRSFFVLLSLLTLILFGLTGLLDDYIKMKVAGHKGLKTMMKLLIQLFLSFLLALMLLLFVQQQERMNYPYFLQLPFCPSFALSLLGLLGVLYLGAVMLVITASSNAVNITDGLDGLAIVCIIFVAGGLGFVAYAEGHAILRNHLGLQYIGPGAGELSIICGAIVGAGMGFLWFNCHPADVFMGDTGSLPLGATLGVIAAILRQEALLVIMGGIFVIEAITVLIQIFSYRVLGFRVFGIAPLHHDLQLRGWHENKVTVRFWLAAAVLAVLGVATLTLRIGTQPGVPRSPGGQRTVEVSHERDR